MLALDLPDLIAAGEEAEIEVEAEDDRLVLGVFGVHDESGESWHGPRLRPLGNGRYRTGVILPRTGVWRMTVKSLTCIPVEPVSDVVVVVDPAPEW
jgi:hypothetical protein